MDFHSYLFFSLWYRIFYYLRKENFTKFFPNFRFLTRPNYNWQGWFSLTLTKSTLTGFCGLKQRVEGKWECGKLRMQQRRTDSLRTQKTSLFFIHKNLMPGMLQFKNRSIEKMNIVGMWNFSGQIYYWWFFLCMHKTMKEILTINLIIILFFRILMKYPTYVTSYALCLPSMHERWIT